MPNTPLREASIKVGPVTLTFAQSMAVRVAINNMLSEVQDPEEKEALGPIADAYRDRLSEVLALIHREIRNNPMIQPYVRESPPHLL